MGRLKYFWFPMLKEADEEVLIHLELESRADFLKMKSDAKITGLLFACIQAVFSSTPIPIAPPTPIFALMSKLTCEN